MDVNITCIHSIKPCFKEMNRQPCIFEALHFQNLLNVEYQCVQLCWAVPLYSTCSFHAYDITWRHRLVFSFIMTRSGFFSLGVKTASRLPSSATATTPKSYNTRTHDAAQTNLSTSSDTFRHLEATAYYLYFNAWDRLMKWKHIEHKKGIRVLLQQWFLM